MKRTYILLSFIFLFLASFTYAQSAKEIFEQKWKGMSVIDSEVSPGGKGKIYHTLYDINYNEAYNEFTARMESSIQIDGQKYSVIYEVDGDVDVNTYDVDIYCGRNVYTDQLPYGLYWTCESLYLKIYKDENHSGHFIMNGKSAGMTKSFEYFELVTYY